MPTFIDKSGKQAEVELSVHLYKEAADNGLTVAQLINKKYPTGLDAASTFDQLCASAGLFVSTDRENGIVPPRMIDVMEGRAEINAGVVVKEANPASRILFPVVALAAIEDKLNANQAGYVQNFNSAIAVSMSINGAKFEQPLINFSNPEGARMQAIAQLAEPASMLSITVSEVSRRIPRYALGMEISDEAMRATTLDLVNLALTRQAETEAAKLVDEAINYLLNGDVDVSNMGPLVQTKASAFDASITTAGTLTHKAWIKWLYKDMKTRTIDTIICDLETAMAIEGRSGKPTVQSDDPNSPRIDVIPNISGMPRAPRIILVDGGVLPANTIMGLDSRYGIAKVTDATAQYQAVENFVLRKSTALRFDIGHMMYRIYDQAFSVLTLVP